MDIRLLGPLEVRDDDGRPADLGSPKQRAVLALLALNPGRVVPADTIAFELWGDDVPRTGANTIQAYVSRLRAALGADAIATHTHGYVLDVAPDSVDAVRFEHAAADARDALDDGDPEAARTLLSDALAMWRGSVLADVIDVPACDQEAARLEDVRLRAIEDRIEADLALGRHADVADELPRLIALHPLREGLSAQHMLALYRCGRQADALAAYGELAARLRGELGIDPGPHLQELERAILRQDADLAWVPREVSAEAPPPRSVPEPLTSFIGRARELDDVRDLLGAARLLTLTGPGGAGKTRLAIESVRSIESVWFVALADVKDTTQVGQYVAEQLDVASALEAEDALVDRFSAYDGVLVLDNCEHVVEAAAALAHTLLSGCPALRIIATSRVTLRASGEVVYRVGPLPVSAVGDADPLASPASGLFADRARAADPKLVATKHADAIADVCRRLDGIPLAIELAAARCDVLTPSEVAERLGDALGLLTTGPVTDEAHHRTLRAALEWTHDSLAADDRRAFRMLGVFVGTFTLSHVGSILGSDALDVMARLVGHSLVETSDAGTHKRFSLLESVRQYAMERLEDAGEVDRARQQHLVCFESVVREHEPTLRSPEIAAAADALEPDMANIRAALSWAIADRADVDAGLHIALSLQNYWNMRGYPREGRRWLEAAIDAGGTSGPDVMQAALAAGVMCSNEGDLVAARRLHERALHAATEQHDDEWTGRALGEIGYVLQRTGGHAESESYLVRALEIAERIGDVECALRTYARLSDLEWWRGNREEAARLLREALVRSRAAGNPRTTASFLLNLADFEREMGDLDAARDSVEEGMDLSRELGFGPAVVVGLTRLGRWALEDGDPAGALRSFEEGAAEARRMGQDSLLCDCVLGIAAALQAQGLPDDALARYREARAIYVRMGDPLGAARVDAGTAEIHLEGGDGYRACRLLRKALTVFDELGEPSELARCLDVAAEIAVRSGNVGTATRLFGGADRLRLDAGAVSRRPYHAHQHGLEPVSTERADAVREALDVLQTAGRTAPASSARATS